MPTPNPTMIPLPPPGPVQEAPRPTQVRVPQYGPDWVAFALAGGEISQGNLLTIPAEETINE